MKVARSGAGCSPAKQTCPTHPNRTAARWCVTHSLARASPSLPASALRFPRGLLVVLDIPSRLPAPLPPVIPRVCAAEMGEEEPQVAPPVVTDAPAMNGEVHANTSADDTTSTTAAADAAVASPAAATAAAADDAVGRELIQWLEASGADTKKLALQEYAPEVRGVHSRKVLVPGERILVIPKKCLITVEMGKNTEIGQKLLAHNIDFVAPKHIFLMMFLLTDMENVRD